MQSECIQKEVHTPISPTHKLWGMLENKKKKLELEKVYYEMLSCTKLMTCSEIV
jgi:hypothetical protein